MTRRTPTAPLDWLNFFLADVRDGLGPYLAIYLLVVQHWNEASIGLVMTIMGVATVAAQTPAGACIDASRFKRGLVVIAALVIAVGCITITIAPLFWVVASCKAVMGLAAAGFPPAIAAITLGITGPKAFTKRVGRNEAFNHAGNATAAILAGLIGWLVSPAGVFYLVSAFGLGSIVSVLAIPRETIDHDLARGFTETEDGKERPSGFRALLENRPLLVFDAPDLPRAARINPEKVTLLRSAATLVRSPEEVGDAAAAALAYPDRLSAERRRVARDLFYEPGTATDRALALVRRFLDAGRDATAAATARDRGRIAGDTA